MNSNPFKVTNKLSAYNTHTHTHIYIYIYIYIKDLALNNPQGLTCHKTLPN